ncbi:MULTISPECIES: hypothetical protein [Myxococcus]|uniref:hypothetical protein n=1 Tax=Myxococcus TaxID=32 RepID=UPI0013CF8E27|nr:MULTISPECIES: hypothetical protein [Myxococcus]NVJ27216.1 hypothetical protein [Myxococcus sp. AM011]
MATTTRAYELLIGTGNDGTDEHVDIELVNAAGAVSNKERPASGDSGRNNYEKGSIEIFDPLTFTLDGTPAKIRVHFTGSKWKLGGLWLTDKTTGETWYALPDALVGSGSGAMRSPATFDLQQLREGDAPAPAYDEFKVFISTASGSDTGTNDKVFLKLFDARAVSSLTQRPGATDNIGNPINDWKSGTRQEAKVAGGLAKMGSISYILLCKYGSNSWNPTTVDAEGVSPSGPSRRFVINHPLTEAANKWIFVRANAT